MKELKLISDLKGLTIESVTGLEKDSEEVIFKFSDGNAVKMWHCQDCCESVAVYEIDGDLEDLIGGLIIDFREDIKVDEDAPGRSWDESWTWTFYNITTSKGSVNIRWLGESNGYYSESVSITRIGESAEPASTWSSLNDLRGE